jgi:helicase
MLETLKNKSRPSEITLLHLVTMTPDMELFYVNASDNWVEDFIDEHQGELNPEENFDWLLKQAKTTALLLEWIEEAKEEYISEVFRVGPGDIRRVAETAEWLMHALAELSKHLELGVTYSAEQLAERIHYGAGPDILALLNLKGVGRVRARKLYQAGYTSVHKLKAADPSEVGKILGPTVAERILAQLRICIDIP